MEMREWTCAAVCVSRVAGRPGIGAGGGRTGWTCEIGNALQFASAELQGDREVVLAAVAENGFSLAYVSTEMRGDREVVLAAVARNGGALQYASAELKADREVVVTALVQFEGALRWASVDLQAGTMVMALYIDAEIIRSQGASASALGPKAAR